MASGSRRQWPRKRVYYVILLYFIGLPAALMVFQVGEQAQRVRWVFSVFPIGFGVLLVLHALGPKRFLLFETRSREIWIPRWIAAPILLGFALWLFYSWIPVVLGIVEFPRPQP